MFSFADLCVRDLCMLIHGLVCTHSGLVYTHSGTCVPIQSHFVCTHSGIFCVLTHKIMYSHSRTCV